MVYFPPIIQIRAGRQIVEAEYLELVQISDELSAIDPQATNYRRQLLSRREFLTHQIMLKLFHPCGGS